MSPSYGLLFAHVKSNVIAAQQPGVMLSSMAVQSFDLKGFNGPWQSAL